MKKIILLGASGSIGTQTLDVIRNNPEKFMLYACSCGRNLEQAIQIISEFKPLYVCVRNHQDINVLKKYQFACKYYVGEEGLNCLAMLDVKATLVNALVGTVGLMPTINAIKTHKDIALANKETLVTAGEIVMKLAREYKVKIYPIDSEHSAIFQCIKGERQKDISKLIITASGGSFRDKKREELIDVTVEDALRHPNWNMGAKITIDSSTMMNKGFEVIEAYHLFGIDIDKIETVLHKESIIHSMVEFVDCSVKAQLGTPDMRVPILYALSYPERIDYPGERLDLKKIGTLHFEELSFERFPCLKMAYQAIKEGGIMPAVLNAANDASVELFLDRKIKYLDIEKIIEYYLKNTVQMINPTIEDIVNVCFEIKKDIYKKFGGQK